MSRKRRKRKAVVKFDEEPVVLVHIQGLSQEYAEKVKNFWGRILEDSPTQKGAIMVPVDPTIIKTKKQEE